MKKNFNLALFFLAVTFLTAKLLPGNVAYAQSVGLGIYPPVLQIDATAPASIKATINVANQTDQNATYNIFLEPFTAGPSYNGAPQFDSVLIKEYKSFFAKVQVFDGSHAIQDIQLAPKQKKSLTLHIGLEKNDEPQDYYFSVIFVSAVSSQENQTGSSAKAGIGTNVLLSVGPKQPAAGLIDQFKTQGFQSSGPVKFDLLVKNTGSSYFAPKGSILIRDMFGKTVGQVKLLPVNILSDSERLIPSSDNSDLAHPQAVWNQKFLLGFYSATTTLSLSNNGPVISKTTTFFAFPVEVILGIIICIILLVAIIKRVKAKQREEY